MSETGSVFSDFHQELVWQSGTKNTPEIGFRRDDRVGQPNPNSPQRTAKRRKPPLATS